MNTFTILGQEKPYQGLESDLQQACIRHAKFQHSKALIISVPNEGKRHIGRGAKLKKMGMTSGVSDLLVLTPSRGLNGLAIELKAKKNKVTDNQINFLNKIAKNGFKGVVVYNRDAFSDLLDWYFNPKSKLEF